MRSWWENYGYHTIINFGGGEVVGLVLIGGYIEGARCQVPGLTVRMVVKILRNNN